MSSLDIFDEVELAKFASIVGDSCQQLARRLGIECFCDNPASCLRKWRDSFSKEKVVQKLTWALAKIGKSLVPKFAKSIDEKQLDYWLKEFAYAIDTYWQSFAKELDFNDDEIQAIVGALDDEPVKCQAHRMVMKWKKKYIYGNTMDALKLAVWEMRRHDLLTALDPSSELSAESSFQPSFVDEIKCAVEPATDVVETDEFKALRGTVNKVLRSECGEGEPEDGMFELLHEAAGETLEFLHPYLKCGIVVFQKGKLCFYALKEANAKWKNGELSKVETLQYAIERITEAVIKGGLTIGGRLTHSLIGGSLGALFGSVVPILGTIAGGMFGAAFGAVCGGKLCKWVGKKIAPIISRKLASVVPRLVSRNDIKVLCIDKLETGDHVITEDAKGVHAIVCGIRCQTVTLVHCDALTNMVRQETVWFRPPWRKVMYRDADTRARAVAKAKDSIGSRLQEEQSSEQFAKWCKFKQK